MSIVTAPLSTMTEQPRLRLAYLDGLRGIAALYVVCFHARMTVYWSGDASFPGWTRWASAWMALGRLTVTVFIVLSGCCLMLPVARTVDGRLRGGFRNYLGRRARRILPPYYAALALSLLLIAGVPGLRTARGVWWDHALPAFTPSVLLTHLALVHNLYPDTFRKVDGAMWSVATEWQIYFLFPALLLPVWRRSGLGALLAVGFLIGLAPHLLFGRRFDEAVPWFLGVFAMGMVAAVVGFSPSPRYAVWRDRVPWGVLAAVGFSAVAVTTHRHLPGPGDFGRDLLTAAATVCLILYGAGEREGRRPVACRLLESRPAVTLGTFSYSLYLVHSPVLGLTDLLDRSLGLPAGGLFIANTVVGVALSVALAWLFFTVFERPCLPGHLRTQQGACTVPGGVT